MVYTMAIVINPKRRAKTPHLEDNLVITKDLVRRICVCKEAKKKQTHNFGETAPKVKC